MRRNTSAIAALLILITAFILIEATEELQQKKVGLLIVATGKYVQFVPPLVDSADKYFCPNHEVTYFVFTDGSLPDRDNLKVIYQKRLGWPHEEDVCQEA